MDCLFCDAGNSSLKLAFADAAGIGAVYSLAGGECGSGKQIAMFIRQIMRREGLEPDKLRVCAVCSVAPGMAENLRGAIRLFPGCEFLLVPGDLPIPLINCYERPEEAGVDRLVAAYGARRIFPAARSFVVADFGSVATFDCVKNDQWLGGLLFPGPAAALEAMHLAAPRLPNPAPDFDSALPLVGRSTRQAMLGGVLHGYAALASGLCEQMAKSLPGPVKIVATGGFSGFLTRIVPNFDAVLPNLVLEGLAALYYEKH